MIKFISHEGTMRGQIAGYEISIGTSTKNTQFLIDVIGRTAVNFAAYERDIRPMIDLKSFFAYMIAHVAFNECDGLVFSWKS